MKHFLHLYVKKLRRFKSVVKIRLKEFRYLYLPFGRKVYIIGTPTHTNIGDSAIVLAQINFIKSIGIDADRVKEFTIEDYISQRKLIKRYLNNTYDVVLGPGGGNMGNIWPNEETFRQKLMDDIPNNPMIIFPQTIHFVENDTVIEDKNRSREYYNNRKSIVLVGREKVSFDIMNEMFPKAEVLLTPDIVLSTDMKVFGVSKEERQGVMLCLRSDKEKSLPEKVHLELEDYLKNKDLEFFYTDMHCGNSVTKQNRFECVQAKMNEFIKSKLVITDRLHGMVFAAITETPCIVFSNYNHKVKGTYEWIKHLDYIKYVESVEEAEKYIPELLKMDDCKFDNEPIIKEFKKLEEVIKRYVD